MTCSPWYGFFVHTVVYQVKLAYFKSLGYLASFANSDPCLRNWVLVALRLQLLLRQPRQQITLPSDLAMHGSPIETQCSVRQDSPTAENCALRAQSHWKGDHSMASKTSIAAKFEPTILLGPPSLFCTPRRLGCSMPPTKAQCDATGILSDFIRNRHQAQ